MTKTTMHHSGHNKGFSLIELLIAMLIGLFLMLGATSLFISNKRIYKEQDAMGRLQENARFAMQILISDIRSAGFAGCAHDISALTNLIVLPATNPAQELLTYTAANNAIDGAESGSWRLGGSTNFISHTFGDPIDAITVRRFQPLGINTSGTSSATLIPTASTPTSLAIGDAAAIYDCDSAHIFRVEGISGGVQHSESGLAGQYATGAELARFYAVRYAVRAENDADGDGLNDLALWRQEADADGTRELELIQGVENMQILYGVDNDNDGRPDDFDRAYSIPVAEWGNIVAVRLSLLFRTITPNYGIDPDTKSFQMLGSPIGAKLDNHRRRQVDTTIYIRNRVES